MNDMDDMDDMDEHVDELSGLAEQFEAHRAHLRVVAYRMLGSLGEAEDAVQEAWLRLSRSDTSGVANLGGWLTTVVARVCLDMLRSRAARREEPLGAYDPESMTSREEGIDPEEEALLAESVGLALLVVLDTLSPTERIAFVLHDVFAVPFDEIAPIVGRSPTAARQLASRARRRVRGGREAASAPDAALTRQREVVDAFLAASRAGDFAALLAVLDPDVMFRADGAAAATGALSEVRGAAAVARQFAGRALGARTALVDGAVGVVVARRGRLFLVLRVTIMGGKIAALDVVADPARLGQLDLAVLDD
jgi:RNA polymerase sigma-70 factor (ECF subfamily)